MPQSLVSNNQHIVFSTKQRLDLIRDPQRMWQYLGGITRNIGCIPMAIGGTANHEHLLASLRADLSISDFVRLAKANSSRWARETNRRFGWQRGFAAFAVSFSNLGSVTRYIDTQEEHHRKRSFEDEFIAMVKKHHIAYDPRYIFD